MTRYGEVGEYATSFDYRLGLKDRLFLVLFLLMNQFYSKFVIFAFKSRAFPALFAVPADFLPESAIHQRSKLPNEVGCSFRIEVASHSRTWIDNSVNLRLPEWALDNKAASYRFVESLGIRTPRLFQTGAEACDIEFRPSTVIKPEDGYFSNGVFLARPDNTFDDVRKGLNGLAPAEVIVEMETLLSAGLIRSDRWLVEELVTTDDGTPAYDVKFYCFYGYCPLALKVSRGASDPHYEFVTRDGHSVDTGKYPQSHLPEVAISTADFERAERISREIPAPFMRVDFLAGKEFVFGEFGNLPGGFARFSLEWDRVLGRAFIDAKARLYADIHGGRSFDHFNQFLISIGTNGEAS